MENLGERDHLLLDQFLLEQFKETGVNDLDVVNQAHHNLFDSVHVVVARRLLDTIMVRMEENEAISTRILDDDEFRTALMNLYAERRYWRPREVQASEVAHGSH
ncbi:MAG: hypothetical protein ACP5PB_10135 [Acidimicrobiales bacterium]